MSNFASEPLVKVTLNLFASDVAWIKRHATNEKWTETIRLIVRNYIKDLKESADD